jgi:deoxyribose-phosphate aldolase
MSVVAVASDHGGFQLKAAVLRHLVSKGITPKDVGTFSDEACDYPVFARAAAEAVARGEAWRAVIIDGAGIGSAMVANKVPGVRAAMAFDVATAKNAGEHNDANVLTLGAGYLSEDAALRIVDAFLDAKCIVDRHKRRVSMIDALDTVHRPIGRSIEAPASAPNAMTMTRPPTAQALGSPSSAPPSASLVDAIAYVLATTPSLLSAWGGGDSTADCPACAGCGHCVSKRSDTVRAVVASHPGVRLSSSLGVGEVPGDIAKLIDHTLLKPDATYAQIDTLCDEAIKFGFASVCVNPVHVKRCADRLRGSSVVVCTVIGFPLGATPSEGKALEGRRAIRDGARELDMVINVGALKSGDYRAVYEDIRAVAEVARDAPRGGVLLKVIIETSLLTDEEKIAACVAAKKARANFVKTSTGFAKGGATAHDVALMAEAVEHKLGVKASGGVASAADARSMILAGATRIGASVGVKIVQEARGALGGNAPGEAKSGRKSDAVAAKSAY